MSKLSIRPVDASMTQSFAEQEDDAVHTKMKNNRKKLLLGFASVLALAGIVAGTRWVLVGSHYVTTDNAYVGAESARVTPLAGGPVANVLVSDTQVVKAGQVLVTLDATDAKLALAQAEADQAKSQADHDHAKIDYDRRKMLDKSGAISAEELTTARSHFAAAEAGLLAATARLNAAQLVLARMTIAAPIDGVVTNRNVEIGQRVEVGSPLMVIVPIGKVYVDANFKEGQLTKVAVGQSVTLTSDLYGDDVTFHGRVAGLSGGTGSAFAIIPAQNATGNWIKVVQRVPVRVSLDPAELKTYPLRVGLSMRAKIDTRT